MPLGWALGSLARPIDHGVPGADAAGAVPSATPGAGVARKERP